MIHRENYSQNILFNFTTESYCECKTIIENWIKYSQDVRVFKRFNPDYII